MIEIICKREGLLFYFSKDIFNNTPIRIWAHLESVAILIKGSHYVIGVSDEKFDIVKPISVVKLG